MGYRKLNVGVFKSFAKVGKTHVRFRHAACCPHLHSCSQSYQETWLVLQQMSPLPYFRCIWKQRYIAGTPFPSSTYLSDVTEKFEKLHQWEQPKTRKIDTRDRHRERPSHQNNLNCTNLAALEAGGLGAKSVSWKRAADHEFCFLLLHGARRREALVVKTQRHKDCLWKTFLSLTSATSKYSSRTLIRLWASFQITTIR